MPTPGPSPRSALRPRRAARLAALPVATLAGLALAAATAVPAVAVPVGPPPPPDPLALHVLHETNVARAAAGCAPLELALPLVAAAERHSDEMAARGAMTHTGADGSTPRTRLLAQGVSPRRTAENVAFGYAADQVVDAWLASDGHRRNVLDCRLTQVGIAETPGRAGSYWTQVFAG
ncbi:CAP domain-containing protein [Kineococcus terrestris]|uniref:CAP domain-containing protein n=1 Tax=Kineococcus terrestris TaxID=2044856 RepID=UPI0034DB5098